MLLLATTSDFERTILRSVEVAGTPSVDEYTFAKLERISQDAGFARVELAPLEIGVDRLVMPFAESLEGNPTSAPDKKAAQTSGGRTLQTDGA